jgi:hypothetical protein
MSAPRCAYRSAPRCAYRSAPRYAYRIYRICRAAAGRRKSAWSIGAAMVTPIEHALCEPASPAGQIGTYRAGAGRGSLPAPADYRDWRCRRSSRRRWGRWCSGIGTHSGPGWGLLRQRVPQVGPDAPTGPLGECRVGQKGAAQHRYSVSRAVASAAPHVSRALASGARGVQHRLRVVQAVSVAGVVGGAAARPRDRPVDIDPVEVAERAAAVGHVRG